MHASFKYLSKWCSAEMTTASAVFRLNTSISKTSNSMFHRPHKELLILVFVSSCVAQGIVWKIMYHMGHVEKYLYVHILHSIADTSSFGHSSCWSEHESQITFMFSSHLWFTVCQKKRVLAGRRTLLNWHGRSAAANVLPSWWNEFQNWFKKEQSVRPFLTQQLVRDCWTKIGGPRRVAL